MSFRISQDHSSSILKWGTAVAAVSVGVGLLAKTIYQVFNRSVPREPQIVKNKAAPFSVLSPSARASEQGPLMEESRQSRNLVQMKDDVPTPPHILSVIQAQSTAMQNPTTNLPVLQTPPSSIPAINQFSTTSQPVTETQSKDGSSLISTSTQSSTTNLPVLQTPSSSIPAINRFSTTSQPVTETQSNHPSGKSFQTVQRYLQFIQDVSQGWRGDPKMQANSLFTPDCKSTLNGAPHLKNRDEFIGDLNGYHYTYGKWENTLVDITYSANGESAVVRSKVTLVDSKTGGEDTYKQVVTLRINQQGLIYEMDEVLDMI